MTELAIILEESHKDLYQWFLMHQECLLLQDDFYASSCWQAFSVGLKDHIDFENRYLVMDDSSLDRSGLRWNLVIYQKEHDKIVQKLTELTKLFNHYLKQQGRVKRITLIELLEHQVTFRHLLEHHETREEEDLFHHLPGIDEEAINRFLEKNSSFDELKKEIKLFLNGTM